MNIIEKKIHAKKKKLKKKLFKVLLPVFIFIISGVILVSALLSVKTLVLGLFNWTETASTPIDYDDMTIKEVIKAIKDKKCITDDMLSNMLVSRSSMLNLLNAVKEANDRVEETTKKIQFKREYITKTKVKIRTRGRNPTVKEEERISHHVAYGYQDVSFSTKEYESNYKTHWQSVYLMAVYDVLKNYDPSSGTVKLSQEPKQTNKNSATTSKNKGKKKKVIGSEAYMQTPYDAYFDSAAAYTGLPVNLIKALARQESSFRMLDKNSAGAVGIMQITHWAVEAVNGKGIYSCSVSDMYDPEKNIMIGACYLAKMIKDYDGDIVLGVAAYNCGANNIKKHHGIPPFKETQIHVTKVIGYFTGKEPSNLQSLLGKYNVDPSIVTTNVQVGTMKNGKLCLTEEEAIRIVESMKPNFSYTFDMVRDSKKKYTLKECKKLPNNGVSVSGDPNTAEGRITICIPKSLLNRVELPYLDITYNNDKNHTLSIDYTMQMSRWTALAYAYCTTYDGKWFETLLKELPRGQEVLDSFSYYAKLAGWTPDMYTPNQVGTENSIEAATGNYKSLDYVIPSLDIPSTAGGMSIPLYTQYDARWGAIKWGASTTIAHAGCGPTTLSMVLSYLTEKCIYPSDIQAWTGSYNPTYCTAGGGSTSALFFNSAKHWGVKCVSIPAVSENAIVNALSKGYPVIVSTGAYYTNEFTKGGHFIVLRGLTSDGKILVNDPNDSPNKSHYLKAYDPSFIVSACHWTNGGGIKYGFYFYK